MSFWLNKLITCKKKKKTRESAIKENPSPASDLSDTWFADWKT